MVQKLYIIIKMIHYKYTTCILYIEKSFLLQN